MFFKQFKVEGLGCLSYMIGCPRVSQAIVVDPKRDIQDYLDTAGQEKMRITGIIETHVHADHVSGARELQVETGAPIYIGEGTPVSYEALFLKDGDFISFGSVKIEVLATPGHTPFSISLAVSDLSRGEIVQMLLTGDLLFVGSVGRPDLAGEELLDEQIQNLYTNLHEKLKRFEDQVEFYPAHGEGSACGKGISSKPSSTLGFERKTNPFFSLDFNGFRKEIKTSIPRRPKNFSHIIETNLKGAKPLKTLPPVYSLRVTDIKMSLEKGFILIDLREAACFGGAHIPGSINIGLSPSSPSWLGDVVDPAKYLILVVPSETDMTEAVTMFRRVGYDDIYGYCVGIMDWVLAGQEMGFLPQISIHALKNVLEKYEDHVLIDVRTGEEWDEGHIEHAFHLPIHAILEDGLEEYAEKDAYISIICKSGYRSNIAASFLKARGYRHIYSVIGGMLTWQREFEIVFDG
jgi:glyoxylase-like metal-dependent hydrolase (beta-lactamase superfamily II)/rhodanese-related sulfurtransferase